MTEFLLISSRSLGNEKTTKSSKRPPSAFLLFSKDIRKKVAQTCPYFSPLDISKVISEQWKTLPEQEKNRYREAAAKLLEEHNKMNNQPQMQPIAVMPVHIIPQAPVPQLPPISTFSTPKVIEPLPSIASFGNLGAFKNLSYACLP